jgi:GDP-4-dehydro-6-deoxy-D-mannose reductase
MAGTVLITGDNGFAGSSLVEHCAREGWSVVGTYHESNEDHSWLPHGVALRRVDLRNRDAVMDLVGSTRPDVVHHLAAQSSVTLSWQDPIGTIVQNTSMQYNVLEAVLAGCKDARVVVVGSCDEYGDVPPSANPVSETQELRPMTPYALSKVTQDLMGRQYASVQKLQVVRMRPFLQLGPRRAARFAVGGFARQIAEIELGARRPVIEVGNVDLVRDFTDVRDTVRAYSLVAQRGEPGEVYNVASGFGHTLREIIQVMLEDAGLEAEIRHQASLRREAEIPLLVGDASRLRSATGWSPEIPFERSVRDTLDYWRAEIGQTLVTGGNLT